MILLILPPPKERLLQDNLSRPSSGQGNGEPLGGWLGLTSLLIVLFLLVLFAKLCFGYRGWAFRYDNDDRTAPMVDDDDDVCDDRNDNNDCDDDIDCEDNAFEKKRDDENDE